MDKTNNTNNKTNVTTDNNKPTLLIGTYNKGKLAEYKEGLKHIFNVIALDDSMDVEDVEETGTTFEENAILKAEYYGDKTGFLTLADDGGLVIPSLGGIPGLRSARWMAEMGGPDKAFLELEKMLDGKDHSAYMYLVICIYNPKTGEKELFKARKDGTMNFDFLDYPKKEGFGYDSVFIPEGYNKPYSVLGLEIKSKVSHRAIVMENIAQNYANKNQKAS